MFKYIPTYINNMSLQRENVEYMNKGLTGLSNLGNSCILSLQKNNGQAFHRTHAKIPIQKTKRRCSAKRKNNTSRSKRKSNNNCIKNKKKKTKKRNKLKTLNYLKFPI